MALPIQNNTRPGNTATRSKTDEKPAATGAQTTGKQAEVTVKPDVVVLESGEQRRKLVQDVQRLIQKLQQSQQSQTQSNPSTPLPQTTPQTPSQAITVPLMQLLQLLQQLNPQSPHLDSFSSQSQQALQKIFTALQNALQAMPPQSKTHTALQSILTQLSTELAPALGLHKASADSHKPLTNAIHSLLQAIAENNTHKISGALDSLTKGLSHSTGMPLPTLHTVNTPTASGAPFLPQLQLPPSLLATLHTTADALHTLQSFTKDHSFGKEYAAPHQAPSLPISPKIQQVLPPIQQLLSVPFTSPQSVTTPWLQGTITQAQNNIITISPWATPTPAATPATAATAATATTIVAPDTRQTITLDVSHSAFQKIPFIPNNPILLQVTAPNKALPHPISQNFAPPILQQMVQQQITPTTALHEANQFLQNYTQLTPSPQLLEQISHTFLAAEQVLQDWNTTNTQPNQAQPADSKLTHSEQDMLFKWLLTKGNVPDNSQLEDLLQFTRKPLADTQGLTQLLQNANDHSNPSPQDEKQLQQLKQLKQLLQEPFRLQDALDFLQKHKPEPASKEEQLVQQIIKHMQHQKMEQDTRHPQDRQEVFYFPFQQQIHRGGFRIQDNREKKQNTPNEPHDRLGFVLDTTLPHLGTIHAEFDMNKGKVKLLLEDNSGQHSQAVFAEQPSLSQILSCCSGH
jgi:hypothetical protein